MKAVILKHLRRLNTHQVCAVIITVIAISAAFGFFSPATAQAWDVLGVRKMLNEFILSIVSGFCSWCVKVTVEMTGFLVKNSLLTTKLEDAMPQVFEFVSRVAKEVTGPLAECLLFVFIALRFAKSEDEEQRGNHEDSDMPEAYTWLHFLIMQFVVMHSTEVVVFIYGVVNKLIVNQPGGLLGIGSTQTITFTGLDGLVNLPVTQLTIDAIGILLVMLVLFLLQLIVICVVYLVSFVIVYGLFMMLYLYLAVAPIPFASLIHPTFKSIGERFFKRIAATALTFFVIALIFYMFPLMLASISFAAIPTPTDFLSASTGTGSIILIVNVVIACLQYLAIDLVLLVGLVRSGAIAREILDV
jgi:hypothetical protein